MLLKYLGHSFFTITTESGTVIATDPYGDFYRYPKRRIRADVCTVSHHHHDHDGMSCIQGAPLVLDSPGAYQTKLNLRVTGVPSKHDGQGGALRGDNTIFIFEAEGLRIAHAGDLGHVPTDEQARQIGRLDALLLPVGGNYTIGAEEAMQTVRLLSPKTVIPMHYRTKYNPDMPVAALDGFLALAGVSPQPMPLLRLTAEDMSERDSVIVMDICE